MPIAYLSCCLQSYMLDLLRFNTLHYHQNEEELTSSE